MQVNILGIRGIPATHGGFETFAAKLASYLVEKGHSVTVYCQEDDGDVRVWEDSWNGIKRVHIRPSLGGTLGTMEFDFLSSWHSVKSDGVDLILGYNTGFLAILQRIAKKKSAMNMDGIEWKRGKWGRLTKIWFFINEIIGANFTNLAIADHPDIARHIKKRCFKEPVMIPYGAELVEKADSNVLRDFGIESGKFFVAIARIEPENSTLEIVQAYVAANIPVKLIVLGRLEKSNRYHNQVRDAAGDSVIFPGAIYDQEVVSALRYYSLAYIHGHTVGGTNPSLVEALGASNTVIAHNNKYNRWVCGAEQFFFEDKNSLISIMRKISSGEINILNAKKSSRERFENEFRWEGVLSSYEKELLKLSEGS